MTGHARSSKLLAVAAASLLPLLAHAAPIHNIILFVPDGLRAAIVDSKTAPTLARLREEGVSFSNSHSLFPTFTTANASAFATGHGLTEKVVLPRFKEIGKPFVLVYWTRDPDGTQHTQGDGDINGPTSMTAIRAADGALASIEQTLKALNLYDTTNIIVAADHGFSTIAKDSEQGARELPTGFLAVDLAAALEHDDPRFKLFDPDDDNRILDPRSAHTSKGDAVIGIDPKLPQVVVAANGGSDLIYLPAVGPKGPLAEGEKIPAGEKRRIRKLGDRIAQILFEKDYVSGLFVDEATVGRIAGALTLNDIGLLGSAKTPRPAIVVNFRSYLDPNCGASRCFVRRRSPIRLTPQAAACTAASAAPTPGTSWPRAGPISGPTSRTSCPRATRTSA